MGGWMGANRTTRLLAACTIVASVFAPPQVGAAGGCSRLADHPNDVTGPNGELYTDQRAGGRLDFTEARFSRAGDDLTIELLIDDFTEPPITTSGAGYWVSWRAPGADARVDIVQGEDAWSFDAYRTYDLAGLVIASAEGTTDLEVEGSVDEVAGLISVLVKDVVPHSAGDTLTNVVVGSAEGGLPDVSGFFGDLIPDRNDMATVALGEDCTSAPDPLRAWCRDIDDPVGDLNSIPLTPGEGARIDLTRVRFLPEGADLNMLISVADLDGARALLANAGRYFLDLTVSGGDLNINIYDVEGEWSASGTFGGQDVAVSVTAGADGDLITVEAPRVLIDEAPRYLIPRASSYEGIGVMSPVGAVFLQVWTMPTDYIEAPPGDGGYFTAVDLDAACPWLGL